MKEFEYKITIIVPVYNAEKYIHKSIESILKQSMDYSDIEVLLLDDGSTDKSLEICQKYSELYSMFKVITKENEGVSRTRNLGISLAKGKYILYLDSDDCISENTLYNIWNFFEQHYDEIDLVTYPLQKYNECGEKKGTPHYRYKFLNKTGIYNLAEYPYIVQTTMNICVKNEENPVCFDEKMEVHEDQDYITRILMKKQNIGYVHEAEYRYIQRNDSVMNSISAMELWFPTIRKYEALFEEYSENIPEYIQALFFNDIKWKLVSDILYPSHLKQEQYYLEINRMKKLLERVEIDIIINYPETDVFHKFYWLSMKPNSFLTFCADKSQFKLLKNNNILYRRERVELIVYRIMKFNNKLQMLFCVKSPVFSFGIIPEVYSIEQKGMKCESHKMMLFPSAFNYYKARIKTNIFWSFYYEITCDEINSVEFKVALDGITYDVSYYFMPQCQIDSQYGKSQYIFDKENISFHDNRFYFSKNSIEERNKQILNVTLKVKEKNYEVAKIREMCIKELKKKKIWLYYDCKGVEKDNGYYQFIHDLEKNDDILRFYISDNSREMQEKVFDENQMKHVVQFGTLYHKLLYVNAVKIVTAFIEENNYNPFSVKESVLLKDMINHQIIYLQHGILHAHLPWKYSPEKINIDKIVVSSYYEISNFVQNYGYKEEMLIKSGMPRFDHFNRECEAKKKILFAPTWRKYLIGECVENGWVLKEKTFVESKFFNKIMDFINSKELDNLLEENGITLDVKLHPIFKSYQHLFSTESKNINFSLEGNNDDEYILFITDFSSYVFDFAYRKRNILYFLPDEEEFKVGLNGYRELDLPFEKAFGHLTRETRELINEIKKIIENDFIVETKYKERMDTFYLPLNDCCEKIYQNLIHDN